MIPAFKVDSYGATESPLPHQISSIINLDRIQLKKKSDAMSLIFNTLTNHNR